jgi:hypothetical protein
MNQYPKNEINTDLILTVVSFKYNESLSDRRAQSTIGWLIENEGQDPTNC